MKNLRIRAILKWCVLALFTMPNFVLAQITITNQDFLGQAGSRQVTLEEKRFSFPIDVGSPGANQVWDFRNQIIVDSVFAVSEFLLPSETVSAGTFPDANLVQKITSPETPGSEFFDFYNLTSDFFIDLGDSSKISVSGFDTSMVFFQNDTIAPLPISFGDTWLTFERDTTGLFPTNANISIDTTLSHIDGWGIVRIPLGDFECLRLRQNVKVINQTIINGQIFSTSVDSFIQYDWIKKNSFSVARAQSQNGDMNPNFTNGHGFGRLDSLTTSPSTGVADAPEAPSGFQLFQNYPNPFNPVTSIRYSVTGDQMVSLKVFDTMGREVATLVDERQAPGVYRVQFDAEGLPSGIYFARMLVGRRQVTARKMLLVE